MKSQNLFFWKNKKNIINLSSAEFAQRVVKVNIVLQLTRHKAKKENGSKSNIDLNTLWANSADDKLAIFFLFIPKK